MIELVKKSVLILTIIGSLCITAIADTGNPNSEPSYIALIENSEMSFFVVNGMDEIEFMNATFSKEKKTVFLETEKQIEYIQILNMEGDLEFQLPIASKKLHLDMQDFNKGTYSLNILLEGNEEYTKTKLQKS